MLVGWKERDRSWLSQFDERHRHYGKAQLADDLVLTPGKHKLALQFANALHESYGPTMAKHIEVNVLN